MGISFERFTDAGAFLEAAGPTLYAFEPHNNLVLGLTEWMVRDGTPEDALLVVGQRQGKVHVAAVRSRPHKHINFILGRTGHMSEEDVVATARWARREAPALAGVMGEPGAAAAFAREWTGSLTLHSARQVRILALDRVVYDGHDKGVMRVATEADSDLIYDWLVRFRNDIGMPAENVDELRESFDPRIRAGEVYFLELDGPVCMAARVRSTRNCDIIGGVYTPDVFRKQGHATALVARLSRLLMSRGKARCALFTDKMNPTSNAIYERIGYRQVMEAAEYAFGDGE